jgi:CRP/FNR family transcriptional regulator, cyclic AMP receptor protein
LGLSHSVSEKLARLLLEWADHPIQRGATNGEIHVKVLLTQDEIAQIIGSSRETVTRLLSDFKNKKLIRVKGSSLVLLNRPALERLVSA